VHFSFLFGGATPVRALRVAANLDLTSAVAAYRAGWLDVADRAIAERVVDAVSGLGGSARIESLAGEAEKRRQELVDFARDNLRLRIANRSVCLEVRVFVEGEKPPGQSAWETISEASLGPG
jgi:hypothetical protein